MTDNENTWDKLLQIKTTGRDDSNSDQYRYPYEPTPYSVLERLANSGLIRKKDVVLDYGCGNALISEHFMRKGHMLELAEISNELVDWLSAHYRNIPIYLVTSPGDILGENKYDFVIAWGLFHHINPNLWGQFLEEFHRLMKPGALLLISGWDDSDLILKEERKLGRFTRQRVWYINMLDDMISWRKDKFDIIESKIITVKLKAFPQPRMIRFIVARNK